MWWARICAVVASSPFGVTEECAIMCCEDIRFGLGPDTSERRLGFCQ